METQLFILGRGISGLSVAYTLKDISHFKITIIGKKHFLNSASRAAQGISTIKGHIQGNRELFRQKMLGHEKLKKWMKELKIKNLFSEGIYEPYEFGEDYRKAKMKVYKKKFLGLMDIEILEKNKDQKINNVWNKKWDGSYFYPNDYFFNPDLFLDALENELKKNGVHFIDDEVKEYFPWGKNGWQVVTEKENKYEAEELIFTVGEKTQKMVFDKYLQKKLMNESFGMTWVEKIEDKKKAAWGVLSEKNSFQKLGNHLRIGGISEERNFQEKRNWINLPKGEVEIRSGYRTEGSHKKPIVDFLEVENRRLFFSCGQYKSGFQLAPVCGEIIKNLLLDIDSVNVFNLIQVKQNSPH